MADFQAIQLTIENQVAWITLNRPDARNAVNDEMREELLAVFTDARTNPDIRALVLTGAGKGFCTGADLSRRGGGPTGPGAAREMMRTRSQRLIRSLWELEKPVIAAVNGVAAGLGAHLAFASRPRSSPRPTRASSRSSSAAASPSTPAAPTCCRG